MMEAIPMDYVKATCKIGQLHDCCRYLVCGAKGFECIKNHELRKIVDERVEKKTMTARGDNCEGR